MAFLLCLAAVCVLGPPSAAREAPPDPPAFPGTPLGALGRLLVEAIDSGDAARQMEFVASHVSAAALAEIPVVERAALLSTIFQQSGGLLVSDASGGNPLEVTVKARRGGQWARIYAFLDQRERDKLGDYGIVPIRDPAVERADVWSRSRLDEEAAVREIERHAAGAASRDEFSGVVLVAKGERVVFHQAYGLADKSWKLPNRPDTKFNLASMNKMFTAVAIAQLVQAGKLRFDQTLASVLPDYPNPESAGKVTIDDLLSHTAGLGMLFDRPGFNRSKRYRASADYFPLFAKEPLLFEPGARSSYSNEGFVVLGAVVEKLSGQSYYDYLRENIFRPSAMIDTDSYAIDDVVPNLAVGYARFDDDPMGIGPRRPNWIFLPWKGSAAGGGYSTAPDLLKFAVALRNHRLLGEGLTRTLLTPHRVARWYGYGFLVKQVGGKEVRGHGGGGPSSGINSEMAWFVDGSYTAIVLGNYDVPAATTLFDGLVEFLSRQ